MAQKKLQRFNELHTFPNVLEKPEGMAGKWNTFFKNNNSIILELACGKGEYTVGLAAMHPKNNYIGIDIKGNRMWAGAKIALENNYSNAGFLRTHIDKIENYFEPDEVTEIWITFPDPQLRRSRAKKRLTHPAYLKLYHNILKKNGIVHLKTDSPDLYIFTKEVLAFYQLEIVDQTADVYEHGENPISELNIKTHYEKLDIAKSSKIFYLKFKLTDVISDKEKSKLFNEYYKTLETPEADESKTD